MTKIERLEAARADERVKQIVHEESGWGIELEDGWEFEWEPMGTTFVSDDLSEVLASLEYIREDKLELI